MENKRYAVFAIVEGLSGADGKILLIQDKGKLVPVMWKLPGGKSEIDEGPDLALIRELTEEIRINIIPPDEKDLVFEKDLGNHIFRVYKVRYYNGEVGAAAEVERIKLFLIDDVKRMIADGNILSKHAQALNAFFAKE